MAAFAFDSSSDAGCDIELLCLEVAVGDGELVRGRLGTCLKLDVGKSMSALDHSSKTSSSLHQLSTYASLSLRLLLPLRVATSSAVDLFSSLLSSIARRSCSSSSYAASRLFIVERRLMLEDSFCRDLESFDRLELLSLEESREEAGGDKGGATGRYEEECCLQDRKRDVRIVANDDGSAA